jgi:formylglycine-generating enzyme required for sulfatase activity
MFTITVASTFLLAIATGSAPSPGSKDIEPVSVQVISAPIAPPGMVYVSPGSFIMGSPVDELGRKVDEDEHEVILTHGFFMGQHEVTQAEWTEVMGNNPSYFDACGPDCPVEMVNWYDALAYCNARSAMEGLEEAYILDGEEVAWIRHVTGYRLPTEAEWEYACRAGTTTPYYNGEIIDEYEDPNCDLIAWYYYNSGYRTHPYGGKAPNPLGLVDMCGNVFEWCWDRYQVHYPPGPIVDPMGPKSGDFRCWRGGNWYNQARYCRSAYRYRYEPVQPRYNLGFRVVRTYRP